MKDLYLRTLLFILSSVSTTAFAQYYPAGLGNGNLKLWLTAADATTLQKTGGTQAANGDFIVKWLDKSGRHNDAVQGTSGSQPVLQTNALNNNGAVIFQNTSQLMTGPTDAYQTLVSVRSLAGTGHYQYLFSSPANADFSIRGGGESSTYTDGPNAQDWTYNTGTTPMQWTNGVQTLNASTTNHILVASAQAATNATYSLSSTFMSRGMNGNDPVYEILAYNTTLNTTQRVLVENYEAAVWGLQSALPATGYTKFTPPAANSYTKNLIGIGYTSATDNVLSVASGNTDGLGFSSSSAPAGFLNTTGFLMAAHNGQSSTVISPATISGLNSGSVISRWNRVWYVQKTGGSAGQLTLSFNFTDYNGSTPNAALTYALVYNATDGSFATGTNKIVTTTSTTVSAASVSFAASAASLSNGYYTITYSSTPISLPATLTGFTVTGERTSALLDWTIQATADLDHFSIQRSADDKNFVEIGSVTAQQDAAATEAYTFTDDKPAAGLNYYRLTLVHTDGSTTFSGIRTFDNSAATASAVRIYPNPTTDRLYITTDGEAPVSIRILDAQGRVVQQTNTTNGTTAIPVNHLPKGIYFAEIVFARSRSTSTFLKN